jgi:hypothetical protein
MRADLPRGLLARVGAFLLTAASTAPAAEAAPPDPGARPAAAATTTAPSRPKQWKLPIHADSTVEWLAASANGAAAFVKEVGRLGKDIPESRKLVSYHALVARTGTWATGVHRPAVDYAREHRRPEKPRVARPSPDGKWLLVVTEHVYLGWRSAYVIPAAGRGKMQLAAEKQYGLECAWVGDKVYLSSQSQPRKYGPISRYDPATGQAEELGASGVVMRKGDPKGRFVLAACHADELSRAFDMRSPGGASLALVTGEGKLLKVLAPISERKGTPVVSPGGKFVAFRSIVRKDGKAAWRVRVVEVAGKADRTVAAPLSLLGVTDDGSVVGGVPAGESAAHAAAVRIHGPGGTSRTLVERAHRAAVGGATLFYLGHKGDRVLKGVPLKAGS